MHQVDLLDLDEAIHPELAKIQNFTGNYPKQIWSLALTEMWERFCFYGNRANFIYGR
jgi:dipeptide/tripeptide permease